MRVDGMQDAGAVIFSKVSYAFAGTVGRISPEEYRWKNIVGRIFDIEEVPVETPFLFTY
jgi:hypothetical protein